MDTMSLRPASIPAIGTQRRGPPESCKAGKDCLRLLGLLRVLQSLEEWSVLGDPGTSWKASAGFRNTWARRSSWGQAAGLPVGQDDGLGPGSTSQQFGSTCAASMTWKELPGIRSTLLQSNMSSHRTTSS